MEVGDLIKHLRINLCLSCRELSQLSGVCHTTINDIERGVCNPTLNTIIKLCLGLNFDVFEFLDITNYLVDQGIFVDRGDAITPDNQKVLLQYDNYIEEFAKLPEVVYIKGLDNCYMVQKLTKIASYRTKK